MSILRNKLRIVVMVVLIVGTMMFGLAPAAHAGGAAFARGGDGGNGGIAVGVGVCAVNIAIVGSAGCKNNGVADASGGDGGNAVAIG